ncbi:MAG: hypothetical protein WCM93_09535 [Bacteroidota bacterium]
MAALPTHGINLLNANIRCILILLLILSYHISNAQINNDIRPNIEYEAAIAKADELLIVSDYLQALNEYEKAWYLYPRQKYPEKKIDQIIRTISNTPLSKVLFDKAIHLGDSCFQAKDYKLANTNYFNALKLDHTAEYPKDQLNEILEQFNDPENETRYRIILIHAGKSFDRTLYDKAISFYKQAQLLKPSEEWPKKRILECETLRSELASATDLYTSYLKESDYMMDHKKWTEADAGYEKALALHPKETYPAAKIVLIDHILKLNNAGQQTYSTVIEYADKFYKLMDYENAGIHYQQALNMKPEEQHPKIMLKKLNHINSMANSTKPTYAATANNADILSMAGDIEAALIGYERCIKQVPGDQYILSRIRELYTLTTKPKEDQKAYLQAIAIGDQSFAASNYTKALSEYRYASWMKPDESYPKLKIDEIKNIVLQEKPKHENDQKALASVDEYLAKKNTTPQTKNISQTIQDKDEESLNKKTGEIRDSVNKQNQIINDSERLNNSEDLIAVKTKQTAPKSTNYLTRNTEEEKKKKGNKDNIINPVKNQQDANQESYLKAIAFADRSLNEKNYTPAINGYKAALKFKPDEKYPKEKIDSINRIQNASERVYKNVIVEAEKAFNEKDYAKALKSYQTALEQKPEQKYPQQKITAINTFIGKQKATQENYEKAITFADEAFIVKDYEKATASYQFALKLKPDENYPSEKINTINTLLGKTKAQQEIFSKEIASADKAFLEKNYEVAIKSYQVASETKPMEVYPKQKIAAIKGILAQQKATQDRYYIALNTADKAFDKTDYVTAITEYKTAIGLLPDEIYAKERITAINTIKSEQKVAHDNYIKAITSAEKAFAAKDYPNAISDYESASVFEPKEVYPQERIAVISEIMARDKEKLDSQFTDYIRQADDLYSKQEFLLALKAYKIAATLKPAENYPKERYVEIAGTIKAKVKAVKEAYDQTIADADKAYKVLAFDEAVLLYKKALEMKPDVPYPGQMVARIRKYMIDNSVVEVSNESFLLKNNSSKRFTFKPVEINKRKNNYLLVRARTSGDLPPKLYVNYGRDNTKNGGIVLKKINPSLLNDFVINISAQDQWFREDNNWLSLYSENGDIEVSSIRISQRK